jgi:Mce-associated membrane protein
MSGAHWYDLLDVDPTASADEIRAAWRSAVADLDPTDRRFRVYNQAAEVLLDPARRAAYDEELEHDRSETEASSLARPNPRQNDRSETEASLLARPHSRSLPVVPGWALVVVAVLLAGALTVAGILLSKPSDSAVESDTEAAQAAAERAIVPLLSYDAHHLDQSAAAAQPFMTSGEKAQYDKLFAVIRDNAPRTGTVVRAKYLASGVVRSGTDRVDVFVLVNQVTNNKQHPKVPVVYKNQVTVSMAKVGGAWLVDGLTTNG